MYDIKLNISRGNSIIFKRNLNFMRLMPPIILKSDKMTINPFIIIFIRVRLNITIELSIIKLVPVNPIAIKTTMNNPNTANPIFSDPSMKKARQALENLPGVVLLNQLVQSSALKCRFQSKYKSKFEFADLNQIVLILFHF
jgi:hypothetical protein